MHGASGKVVESSESGEVVEWSGGVVNVCALSEKQVYIDSACVYTQTDKL